MRNNDGVFKEVLVKNMGEFRSLVCGTFDCIRFPKDILLVFNPKGAEKGFELKGILYIDVSPYYQAVFGPYFFVGVGKEGEPLSLQKTQIEWLNNNFHSCFSGCNKEFFMMDLRKHSERSAS